MILHYLEKLDKFIGINLHSIPGKKELCATSTTYIYHMGDVSTLRK